MSIRGDWVFNIRDCDLETESVNETIACTMASQNDSSSNPPLAQCSSIPCSDSFCSNPFCQCMPAFDLGEVDESQVKFTETPFTIAARIAAQQRRRQHLHGKTLQNSSIHCTELSKTGNDSTKLKKVPLENPTNRILLSDVHFDKSHPISRIDRKGEAVLKQQHLDVVQLTTPSKRVTQIVNETPLPLLMSEKLPSSSPQPNHNIGKKHYPSKGSAIPLTTVNVNKKHYPSKGPVIPLTAKMNLHIKNCENEAWNSTPPTKKERQDFSLFPDELEESVFLPSSLPGKSRLSCSSPSPKRPRRLLKQGKTRSHANWSTLAPVVPALRCSSPHPNPHILETRFKLPGLQTNKVAKQRTTFLPTESYQAFKSKQNI